MATILGDKVKLDNGQLVTPQQGGWYDGQQYWGGTLSAKNQINPLSNQQGAGQQVSSEVRAQSAAAQGVSAQQFDDYLFGKGKTTPASSGSSGVSTPSGSGSGSSGAGAAAKYNVKEEYDKLYKELGIDDLKAQTQAKQAEIDARRARLEEAKGVINENPFYAEATRVGKMRRLEEQADGDIQNLAREQALIQNQIAEANQTLATRTNLGTQQYQIDRQAAADAVAELNALLSSGANMSGINAGDFAARTGMSVDTISALIDASQQKEIKPTVITSTNDAGVVTVTIIDQMTGAIVGQQSLGAIGNKQGSGGGKATESEVQRYYMDSLRSDVASGVGVREVYRLYSGYLDPNQILQIYNSNSPHGVAKESPEELAAYGVKF